MKAISEAIAVIHSDDARDLFKRSAETFLQVSSVSTAAAAQALSALQETAHRTGDLRVSALAMRLNAGAKFDKVISAIDKMVKELEDEQDDDNDNKDECESEREKNTKETAELSRNIDELSDDISKLKSEIEENNKEIAEQQEIIDENKKDIKNAKNIRAEEHADWEQADADDSAAIKLLEKSATVLKSFYKENFGFLQATAGKKDPPVVEAGEAPPPPPKTWDDSYGGAQKESKGIVSILELIRDDTEKGQTAAKKAEDQAQKDHDKFVKDAEKTISDSEDRINELEDSNGKKEKSIGEKDGTKNNKKGRLNTVVEKMKEAAPGCDFLLVNFKVRKSNRDAEISGLNKAKAILKEKNK